MLMPGDPSVEIPDHVWDIMMAQDDLSVREQKIIDDMMNYGELYHVGYMRSAAGQHVFTTDLGQPREEVEIRLPGHLDMKKCLQVIGKMCSELCE